MELALDKALQKGTEAHKAGNVQEAERYYAAILKAYPKHPDANHNMGVLAVGVCKVEAALPFFKTALDTNPQINQFWLSYIDALIKLNRLDDAKAVLNQARDKGVRGDGFDNLEKQLTSPKPQSTGEAQDPPQDRLQSLINLYKKGQNQECLTEASQLLNDFPKSVTLYNIIGAINQGLGNLDQAIDAFNKAISIKPDYVDAYNNIGVALKKQGKFDQSITAFNKAISIKPDYAEAYSNMGNTLKDEGKLEEAVKAYNTATSLKPNYADAYNNMGVALQEQGKLEKAIEAYKEALLIKPDYPEAYNNMGVALKDQGKLEEAIKAFKEALLIKPDYAEAYYNMGDALKDEGKLEEAVKAYNTATSLKPNYADAYNNMGVALQEQGKLEKAIEAYKEALLIKPDYAEAYNNLGVTLIKQGKLDKAIEAYNKALTINSASAETYNNMGSALQDLGELKKAQKVYAKACTLRPDYTEAHRNLSSIKKYKLDDSHFIQVKELFRRKGLSEESKCNLSFALAKMYEDIGNNHKSFNFLIEGSTLRKKLLNYSIDQDKHLFSKLKNTQPHIIKNSLEIKQVFTKLLPIFILGMPRSGTTLVEQIISSHSLVADAGELNYIEQFGLKLATEPASINNISVSEFRKKYLSEVLKLSNGQQFITDKMPQNFRFIPLICAAFPEARIIHVQRDPKATCWSNFKQYFVGNGLGYCYDLKDIVSYHKLYTDLIKLWQSEYSDRIYNLNYEKLTENPENETRKLIEYLELDWEDACLSPQENKRSVRTASQQQVRQKVYKGSSEAWRKYEPFLDGAFDSLPSS